MGKILVIHPDDLWSQAPVQIGMISEDTIELGFDMDIAEVTLDMPADEAARRYPIEEYEQVWIYSGHEFPSVRRLLAEAGARGIPVLKKSYMFPSL